MPGEDEVRLAEDGGGALGLQRGVQAGHVREHDGQVVLLALGHGVGKGLVAALSVEDGLHGAVVQVLIQQPGVQRGDGALGVQNQGGGGHQPELSLALVQGDGHVQEDCAPVQRVLRPGGRAEAPVLADLGGGRVALAGDEVHGHLLCGKVVQRLAQARVVARRGNQVPRHDHDVVLAVAQRLVQGLALRAEEAFPDVGDVQNRIAVHVPGKGGHGEGHLVQHDARVVVDHRADEQNHQQQRHQDRQRRDLPLDLEQLFRLARHLDLHPAQCALTAFFFASSAIIPWARRKFNRAGAAQGLTRPLHTARAPVV